MNRKIRITFTAILLFVTIYSRIDPVSANHLPQLSDLAAHVDPHSGQVHCHPSFFQINQEEINEKKF